MALNKEIGTIEYQERIIQYAKIGDGSKPFVIFPGISLTSIMGSADGIAAAYSIFLDEYTMYVFDRPLPQNDEYTMDDLVDERIYVLDYLKISDAYLAGVSIGGMIALEIALKRGDLFKKMVLASSTARVNEKRLTVLKKWEALSNNYDIEQLNASFYENLFTDNYTAAYRDVILASLNQGTQEDCVYYSRAIRTMYDFDILAKISDIDVDILVMCAENDTIFYPESSREIADAMNCEYYMYKTYRHGFYDETEDYKRKVYAFFS